LVPFPDFPLSAFRFFPSAFSRQFVLEFSGVGTMNGGKSESTMEWSTNNTL
jgi:hypothetical protein